MFEIEDPSSLTLTVNKLLWMHKIRLQKMINHYNSVEKEEEDQIKIIEITFVDVARVISHTPPFTHT